MIKSAKRFGFTLVELLIAIIIIIILVAILMLSYGAMVDKSKATSCLGNRETIQTAYSMYKLNNSEAKSFDIFLKNEDGIADSWVERTLGCPSKGTYTAEGNIVICSIHNPTTDPGGGTTSNMIPGTADFGGDGFIADSNWEEKLYINTENQRSMIGFEKGEKFFYESKYYIAVETLTAIDDQGNNNPDQNAWWTIKSAGGLVQLTGVSKNWDEISHNTRFVRGDILYYKGDYYVSMVHGDTGFIHITKNPPTQHNPNPWNNTPDLSGQASAWYKLP